MSRSSSANRRKRGQKYAPKQKEHTANAVKRAGAGTFCPSGKVVYATRKIARSALRRRFHGSHGEVGMMEYRCPDCDRWHIGHKPRWKRQEQAA